MKTLRLALMLALSLAACRSPGSLTGPEVDPPLTPVDTLPTLPAASMMAMDTVEVVRSPQAHELTTYFPAGVDVEARCYVRPDVYSGWAQLPSGQCTLFDALFGSVPDPGALWGIRLTDAPLGWQALLVVLSRT